MGGMHSSVNNLLRQVQGNTGGADSGGQPTPGAGQPLAAGEPQNMNYGTQGTYNTLAQDMSRNVMGNYGFGGNQFSYSPFGNPFFASPPMPQQPYQPTIPGGYGGYQGGYGGGYGMSRQPMPAWRPSPFGGMSPLSNPFAQPTIQPVQPNLHYANLGMYR